MTARGKRTFIKPYENEILEMVIDNPGLKLEALATEIIQRIEWPSKKPEIEGMVKRIRKMRKGIKTTPEDKPWSTATLKDNPIPPESLPLVLELWRFNLAINRAFTIREAKWATLLSAVKCSLKFPPFEGEQNLKPVRVIGKRGYKSFTGATKSLAHLAALYAHHEQISGILQTDFDTGGLDRWLAGIPATLHEVLQRDKKTGQFKRGEPPLLSWGQQK